MLASFTKALADGPPLKRGAELVFELQQAGVRLVMGKHVVELKGKALSEALLATYLDGKAVAPDFKEQVLKGGLDSRPFRKGRRRPHEAALSHSEGETFRSPRSVSMRRELWKGLREPARRWALRRRWILRL